MQFQSWSSFDQFEERVSRSRRYIRDAESERFLKVVAATCKKRVRVMKKGTIFYRARVGHGWDLGRNVDDPLPAPRPEKEMFPPPQGATEGRVNPKGITYLYMATTKEAALSEVRPWVGSLISVGDFEIKRDVRIINCSLFHNSKFQFYFSEPSAEEREKAVWGAIDRAFARPAGRTDDVADYAATQTLAELFRDEGYDGIFYKSAFGEKGFNLALFDLNCANLLKCSLYEAKTLSFDFAETANPYFVTRHLNKNVATHKLVKRKKK